MKIKSRTRSVPQDLKIKASAALETLLQRKDLGFFDLPQRNHLWESAEKRGSELQGAYKKLGIIGIGGSSLGVRVFDEIFAKHEDRLLFLDNIDPVEFHNLLKHQEDFNEIHWLLISKSGGTIESLTVANFLSQILSREGVSFEKNVTVISEVKESPLTSWAGERDIPIFEIPIDVGGRFSILTPVGLIPAAFLGLNLSEIKKGTEQALNDKDLVTELVGQSLLSFQKEEWITAFWFYSSYMNFFGRWVQQLWAESLAKRECHDGREAPRVSTPLPCIGTCDQHSVLQQFMEGHRDKFIWFFQNEEANSAGEKLDQSLFSSLSKFEGRKMGELLAAELTATVQALEENHVHSLTISIDGLNPSSLGQLFMAFELVVGSIGEALGINAFDQPGVERGKALAKTLLGLTS